MPNRNLFWGAIFFLAFTFGVQSARAQDEGAGATDPTQKLQNLVYYPHGGRFLFTPTFTTPIVDYTVSHDSNGNTVRTTNTDRYELTLALTYGVFDRFRVGISESETFDQTGKETVTATGAGLSNQTRGLSNPTLTATYRYIESQANSLYADLGFNLTPSIGTRLADSNGQTGNENGGAWTASLGLPVYWIIGINELEAELEVTRSFGGTSQGTTPGSSGITSSYWNSEIILTDRVHLGERFYVQPSLTFNLPYSDQANNFAAGSLPTEHNINFYLTPAVSIGYLVKQSCLVSASVSYYGGEKNEAFPEVAKSSDTVTTATTANVNARFEF